MLAMICVVYQVGTVWLDKLSIPHIGSPLYAAMLPFRMVSTRDKMCLKHEERYERTERDLYTVTDKDVVLIVEKVESLFSLVPG